MPTMADYNPLDPDSDPFRPPAIPTLVGCLHCGQEYESFLIEWRIETGIDNKPHGYWCCPTEGCDGRGFGFDILPIDPTYQDERSGWMHDGDDEELDLDEAEAFDEDDPFPDDDGFKKEKGDDEDDELPF